MIETGISRKLENFFISFNRDNGAAKWGSGRHYRRTHQEEAWDLCEMVGRKKFQLIGLIPDILLWANYSIVEIVDSFPVRAVGIDFYVNLR